MVFTLLFFSHSKKRRIYIYIYICIYIFPSLSCAASKSINQNAQLATSPPPSIPLDPPFPLSLILFLVSLMGSTPYEKKNLLRLRCSVQNYDWGLKGHDSRVARLSAHNSGSEIRPDTPYAEFWMGTHQSGPSFVVHTPRGSNGVSVVKSDNDDVGVSLKSWISDNPNVLGDKVLDKWGCDLPFLFKVINTILLMFFHMRLCLWIWIWISVLFLQVCFVKQISGGVFGFWFDWNLSVQC